MKNEEYTYLGGLMQGIGSLLTGMKTTIKVYFRKKVTEQYPENRAELKMFDRFRGTLNMPHNENNEHRCVACGLCQMACPNDTIKVTSETIETEEGNVCYCCFHCFVFCANIQNIYDIYGIYVVFYILGFTLQTLTLYVQMHEAPGSHPAGGYSLISLFNNRRYNCYTSVIFRYGRNFSRPMVYCFFKVGNAPVSSYCQPEPFKAVFMALTAFAQVMVTPSTFVASPVPLPIP